MKKTIVIALCLLIASWGCTFSKEIVISRDKIQESVSKKFPYEKDIGLAHLTVATPEVYFKGKNIGLKALYYGNLLEKEIRGTIDVYGNIVYRPETGSFYLREFNISDFTVNDKDLLEKIKIHKVIDKIISNYLDGYPIYRLNPDDYRQNLARLWVKDVFIRKDDLVILIGY